MDFYEKYLKYKNKYLELKNLTQQGSGRDIFTVIHDDNLEEFTRLIKEGVDVNKSNDLRQIPIVSVVQRQSANSVEMIKILLEHKAKINDLPYYKTALLALLNHGFMMTQREDYVFLVSKILIENGVKLDEQDIQGKTALHYAVENRFNSVIKLLLEKGANPNIESLTGTRVLQTANFNYGGTGQKEIIIKLLESYGAKYT